MAKGRGFHGRVKAQLQKRLPQELRMAAIKTVAVANRYLKSASCPATMRFAVPHRLTPLGRPLGIGT